ncbi:MAG: hypothetical protein JOZ24_12820, partial [Candidatus Eremiobacteraeota bacterium]|nr:hypothetical protein [Candidatus Eremiobacteraeota bacterium]
MELPDVKPAEAGAPRHGAHFGNGAAFSPDAVAAALQRGDGGFGRRQETYFDHPILRKPHWRWE